MERERNLLMSGKSDKVCAPRDLANHPVFMVNCRTNTVIAKRRAKLKTVREKNAERLVKQGVKWEKERFTLDEENRLKEEEAKERREQLLEQERLYTIENNQRGVDLLRIKNRDFTEAEHELEVFLKEEREEMLRTHRRPGDPMLVF